MVFPVPENAEEVTVYFVSVARRSTAKMQRVGLHKSDASLSLWQCDSPNAKETGMRLKKEAVLSFESNDDGLPKVVRDYRRWYRRSVKCSTTMTRCSRRCTRISSSFPKGERTDTTVVESNIHYQTDAWLLWDAWRVASRLLTRARESDRLAAERYQTPGHTALPFFGMTFTPRTF